MSTEVPLAVYGEPDEAAVRQLRTCASRGDATAAADGRPPRRRFVCPVRGCGHEMGTGRKGRPAGRCPDHPNIPPKRIRVRGGGLIGWETVRADLRAQGLELRGAGPDEAPGVYKKLSDVVAAHSDHVRVVHTLRPLGVAMAGPDILDPYKD